MKRPKPTAEERRQEADLTTLRAQNELDRGCTHCGRAWYLHYRRGEFISCTGAQA